MKNHKKFVSYALIIALLVVSIPLTSFADSKGKNDDKGEKNKVKVSTTTSSTNQNSKGWTWAFGHLIAPGWLKKNGDQLSTSTSSLPPGILKLLNRGHEDNDGDKNENEHKNKNATTTAPFILSNFSATASSTKAKITWQTNQFANETLWFSTTTPVDTARIPNVSKAGFVLNHKINLTGLAPSTTYYVVVQSKTFSGKIATSSQISFTTMATQTPPPVPPVVTPLSISNALVIVGSSSVIANWTTNAPATSKIFYSTATPVNLNASTTPLVLNGSLVTSHSLTVTGLSTSTVYHMVIQSIDGSNSTSTTPEFFVTTGM